MLDTLSKKNPGVDSLTIKIFTTGGTIDKTYFDAKSEYHVGEPQAAGVLERANIVINYEVESILKKDSLDLDDEDRNRIRKVVAGDGCRRIIITHGTDTMIKTASVLEGIPEKTIVMTGSMYPAQFRDSDAVFNLGSAVMAVQLLEPGIYIAMNGQVFDPGSARKNVEQNRFEELGG